MAGFGGGLQGPQKDPQRRTHFSLFSWIQMWFCLTGNSNGAVGCLAQKRCAGWPEAVFINMDETPVAKQMKNRRGWVLELPGKMPEGWYARINTRDTRAHVTLVGMVCDDAALQKHLPQIILAKDENLTRAEKAALRSLAAPTVWMENVNGWMTCDIMKRTLTLLRRLVLRAKPNVEIVVCFDCAAQHLHHDVMVHASRLKLHVMVIPSGMTWLLQPLDTHVFASFKRALHDKHSRARALHPLGVLSPTQWIDITASAIKDVLVDLEWSHAMMANGLHSQGVALRAKIANAIGCVFPMPARSLTNAQLAEIMSRTNVDSGLVLRQGLRLLVAPPAKAPPPLPPPRVLPRLARLRVPAAVP